MVWVNNFEGYEITRQNAVKEHVYYTVSYQSIKTEGKVQ